MQDAENVAAPEAAEQRAEPGPEQPAAEPSPGAEVARPGVQEAAGGEDAEAEAAPGPERPAEPAADGDERADATPGATPPPPEESSAPLAGEARAEQAQDAAAEAGSEGAGGEPDGAAEDGGADEPSFSDPEDFVDDVSEEGEAAGPRRTEVPGPPPDSPRRGKASVNAWTAVFPPKEGGEQRETTWRARHGPCSREVGGRRGPAAGPREPWPSVQGCGQQGPARQALHVLHGPG